MQRASKCFSDEQRRQIDRAVAEAENKTSAEILPVVATAARSLFKAGVKSGIILYEKARMVTDEARESLEDMTAEAKSEMKTGKSKAKTSKAAA